MTIVLMPEDTNELRHFRVPRILLFLFIPIMLISLTTPVWFIRDYLSLKAQIPKLAKMEQESQFQEGHFIKLAGRIKQLAYKVKALTEFDYKLKALAGLEKTDAEADHRGMGGSPMHLDDGDFLESEKQGIQEKTAKSQTQDKSAEEPNRSILSSLPNIPLKHETQNPDTRPDFKPMVRQKIKRTAGVGKDKIERHQTKTYASPVAVKPSPLRKKTENDRPKISDIPLLQTKKAYSVQVGAFLVKENAERLAARLRQRGYNPYVKGLLDRLEKEWHTVRLRDFTDFEEALRLAETYRIQEGKLAIVTPLDSLTQIISNRTKRPASTQLSSTGD